MVGSLLNVFLYVLFLKLKYFNKTNIENKNLKYLNIFNKLINLFIQERRILKETSIKKIPNIKSKKLKTKLIKIFSRKSKVIIENKSIII